MREFLNIDCMDPERDIELNKIYNEPNLSTLARMPDNFVDCIVTSPPYWGLRDYGHADQLGLEETPEQYVANMVAVFRECRRVLKETGTFWLNLGDSYCGYKGENYGINPQLSNLQPNSQVPKSHTIGTPQTSGLKPKDLVGIPWRVALALQADGWYLRSDIIWHKPNPMPESVTDRPTKAHEYIFLLTKNSRYYYDAEAVKEPHTSLDATMRRNKMDNKGDKHERQKDLGRNRLEYFSPTGRNRRTVWAIPTKPYSGAHFAVFPPDLIKPCVLAGSPEKVCEYCGKTWERVVEKDTIWRDRPNQYTSYRNINGQPDQRKSGVSTKTTGWPDQRKSGVSTKTTGWQPTCTCPTSTGSAKGIVYDPFGGSGTTAEVAATYGRKWILSELNPDYVKLAEERLAFTAQLQLF